MWPSLALGVALTAWQILLALLLSPGHPPGDSYARLCRWDCAWYEAIARDGYRSTIPPVAQSKDAANVAFFPGYPYLARALHLGLRLPPSLSLLIVAQLFALVFWAALWRLLRRWRIPPALAALVVLGVLAHPAAFYLVAGYSESLFLAALLLFILCGAGRRASLAGFAMSATRIIGLPAAGFPLARQAVAALAHRRLPAPRTLCASLATAGAAASGTLAFLLYCRLRFGRSDLYMLTQRIGWGIVPDYSVLWKWAGFRYFYPFDRVATVASGWVFVAFALLELLLAGLGRRTGLARRVPVYGMAFGMFFVTLSGLECVGFRSMIRYTLPWHILLLLCLAHLASRLVPRPPEALARAGFVLTALGLLLFLYRFQVPHLREFLAGRWFA